MACIESRVLAIKIDDGRGSPLVSESSVPPVRPTRLRCAELFAHRERRLSSRPSAGIAVGGAGFDVSFNQTSAVQT